MKLSGEFLREKVITITKGFYYWAIRMVQHENQLGNITKKNAILRNKLNQGSEELYAENQKTLLKEIKDDRSKWKDILCL